MKIFCLTLAFCLPSAAIAQDLPVKMQRFCLPSDATIIESEFATPLEALRAVNTILDQGDMLTIEGNTATFQDAWIGGPDFTVRANHNDTVVMDRGLIMEGGPGCNAWRQASGVQPRCDWEIATLPNVDLSAEPTGTAFMVWETLLLRGDDLTLVRVESGGREVTSKTYNCDDPAALLRYMRVGD